MTNKKKTISLEDLQRQLDEAVAAGWLVKRWNNELQEFTYQDVEYAKPKRVYPN